jgi:spermidine synthase
MTEPEVLERLDTSRGELVLRRRGDEFEVISNGVFLMDTSDGRSERLLARAALDAVAEPRRVLIGGLGVGFSLQEVLADARVEHVVVVEVEPAVVAWHATHLAAVSGGVLTDPRVSVMTTDLLGLLDIERSRYDAICLDIDNGPEWTVAASNAALYSDEGTHLVASRLATGGALSVWGAAASSAYDEILRRHLDDVRTLAVEVDRGEPDVVWVGRRRQLLTPCRPRDRDRVPR